MLSESWALHDARGEVVSGGVAWSARDGEDVKMVALNPKEAYSADFMSWLTMGSARSARAVLGVLFGMYKASSVLDVGCGPGAWLVTAGELGATILCGVDGQWVGGDSLLSSKFTFRTCDLELPLPDLGRFDACVSVEVAEHLSEKQAAKFVASLCCASDVIVFSAAIPLQGGVGHKNEQWQSHWAGLFQAQGYEALDVFRPRLWNDASVEPWYRQNVLLYVKSSHAAMALFRTAAAVPGPLDLAHPLIYTGNLETLRRSIERPSIRFCLKLLRRWVSNRVRSAGG